MSDGIDSIHHINFLVRDLDAAEQRYRSVLGLGPAIRDELPGRQVITARFKLGDSWLVLVQPTSEEGEPARYLRENGEGFFLIAFGVNDLDVAMQRAKEAGSGFTTDEPRTGLDGWRTIDVDPADTFGAIIQLTEE